jgi:putative ABC transport system substrate-binding protein
MRSLRLCLAIAACLFLGALGAHAQSGSVPRIGWISLAGPDDAETSPFFEAFRQGLRELGYIEGRNLIIEARWARGDEARGRDVARELVQLGVSVIVTQGAAIRAVRPVAGSTPVVFGLSADPVKAGLADSYARPGRNYTGVTFMMGEVNVKRIELLKQALPGLSRIALLSNPEHAGEQMELEASRKTAEALGMTMQYLPVRTAGEFRPAVATAASSGAEAIVVLPDALVMQHRAMLIGTMMEQGIPSVSGWSAFAQSGGVFTYGPNLRESYRALGRFVDKILKGAKPAELPIEQPAVFELVINLKAARALGVTLPPSLLARADEVIE